MRSVLALAKRNCLCYFRDRASVVFSLMAALIVLMLYLFFLRDMLIGSFDYPGMGDLSNLVDVWVISGLMSVVSVTTCAGALQTMVSDRVEGREADILVTPIGPLKVACGHILSTFVVGLVMTLVVLAIGLVYLAATGCPLSASGIAVSIILTVPSALSGCIIMYACTSFFRSTGAFSGFFTVVSVLIGFLTGIYMPLGSMPGAMQVVSEVVPATHIASLFRQSLAGSALDSAFSGVPLEKVEEFRETMGFDITFCGYQFSAATSILFVIVVTLVFFVIPVLKMKRR